MGEVFKEVNNKNNTTSHVCTVVLASPLTVIFLLENMQSRAEASKISDQSYLDGVAREPELFCASFHIWLFP